MTFYDEVGGAETFAALVHHFYAGVADDEPLRALYPEEDLGPAERRLRMFLEQYWGGPTTYSEQRGHPRLRMRHMQIAVDSNMRDQWMHCMRHALDQTIEDPVFREELYQSLWHVADHMRNRPG